MLKEWHFVKDYRSKQGNIARSVVYQELDLDDNWDIVLADFDDSSVYSISEGECETHQSISVMVQDTPVEESIFMAIEKDDESDNEQEEEDNQFSHYAFMFHPGPPTKIAEMVQVVGSWKPNKELPAKSKKFPEDSSLEWLVMPFGLKNAPAVFQRKMDKCFKGTESFIAVYIDDILVFSKNEKDHAKHLEKMLKICEETSGPLSPTKMKIAKSQQ
ncbi:Orf y [Tanacetum coccineum]